jgi:hypothetical protein
LRARWRWLVCAAWLLCALAFDASARELTLEIGDLQSAGLSAQSLRARLRGEKLEELTLDVDRLSVAGRTWRKARLTCPKLELTGRRASCAAGTLDAGEKIVVSFSYVFGERQLLAELKPATDEVWRVTARFAKQLTAEVKVDAARLTRLSPWLPADLPRITAGRASGVIGIDGNTLKARVDVASLAFADANGLHAGEKIGATLEADAVSRADEWRWNARLTWRAGEVFWQPFFVAAKGQRIELQATTARGITQVRAGTLELPNVASVGFSGDWDHAKGTLRSLEARAKRVRVGALYDDLLKPLLEGTALSDLRAEGEASFILKIAGGEIVALDTELTGVSFEDRQRRFGVFGLSGRVPWQRDGATTGELSVKGAEFLKVPVGAARVPLRLRATRVAVDKVRIPILDGALVLHDFAAARVADEWRWRFSGELEAISMTQLTQRFEAPVMYGSLSGVIPEVRYRRGTLAMDGALAIRAFDGTITASNVQLIEPFGRAPRLHADVEMKNLDLELLTRRFDFGTITGRIDAYVRGLELVGWEPVRFDARIASSPGDYPRRISQRAVQNISALGGAGAAVAIQRSFLRFFEQFGYARLGLSCRLQNGVCEMDGIERAPQGYVIVKGGGIPAISVIGYNRAVDWRELVERLKRITQENVKPIVK